MDNFGEALRITQDHLDSKNFYAFNPSFDVGSAQASKTPPPCGA